MKILAINTIKYNNNHEYHIQNTAKNSAQPVQGGVYNPIYYKDYNIQISFGKRSPEEFYAMESNRENMPKVMKEYLFENYNERSKLAPIQVMQEAYDDLSVAATVDDIRELFPQGREPFSQSREPKFDKLRPAVYSPSKVGILGKIGTIKAMQENPEPLFKDGSDDLTTYLVKKIYLEGKTAKEIDKDFAQDINEVYELAARVPAETTRTLGKNESVYFTHSTIYNLGIRFPEVSFWNSFINTRDDYERKARVKTSHGFVNAEDVNRTPHQQPAKAEAPEKPRKYTFKRDRVKKFTDIIVNTTEGSQKALKEVQRRGGRDSEELSFLQRYWSEIMTLATEKIHLSEEMIDFNATRNAGQDKIDSQFVDRFVNGGEITKRQKTPLKIFWDQRPDLKEYFSQSITDVIMQFTDAYGADGENSYFKALLIDAHNAKPMRELAKIRHEEIQAEYDEMGRQLMAEAEEANPTPAEQTLVDNLKTTVEEIQEATEPEFKYVIDGHEITMPYDIKAKTYELLENDFQLIPRKLYSVYVEEFEDAIKENPLRYYLNFTTDASSEDEVFKKLMFPGEECAKINETLIGAMEDKHNAKLESCRVALIEVAKEHGFITQEQIPGFANMDLLRIRDTIMQNIPEGTDLKSITREIEAVYREVSRPLVPKERTKIRHGLVKYIDSFKNIDTNSAPNCIRPMIKLISLGMNTNETLKDMVKGLLDNSEIARIQGPSMRYLLKENGDEAVKEIIREHTLRTLISRFQQETSIIMQACPKEMEEILAGFPQELEIVKAYARRALWAAKNF